MSISCNVLGYERPGSAQKLVDKSVDKLEAIVVRVEELLTGRLADVLSDLRGVVRRREVTERARRKRRFYATRAGVKTMVARRVLQRLLQWIRAVPVVGLNFQHYDLNVLKPFLMRRLVCTIRGVVVVAVVL